MPATAISISPEAEPPAALLDTVRSYETPEGIALELRLAGPLVRALAWVIDLAIRLGFYLLLTFVLTLLGGVGTGLTLIGLFLVEWFYPTLFEVLQGATPGKRAMGLSVIHDNGTPIGWPASLIRNLLRAADFFPFLYGAGLVCTLLNRDFKRLGDLAAGTLVVYRESPPKRQALPDAPAVAPPLGLDFEEQRLLLAFAERSPQLSRERNLELAAILEPLTQQSGPAGLERIYGYANWLAGKRTEN